MGGGEPAGRPSYVLVGVLGFDEKFLARCLMRVYARGGLRSVSLLVPRPVDNYTARRIGEARASLEKIARDYAGASIEFREVERGSLIQAYMEAKRVIEGALGAGSAVVVCLSGGMRYMLLALLAAALGVPRGYPRLEESIVEVDLESGEGHISIPLRVLRSMPCLDHDEARVLQALIEAGRATLTELASRTGLAKSTVWNVLQRLVKLGLAEDLGRRRGYRAALPEGLES